MTIEEVGANDHGRSKVFGHYERGPEMTVGKVQVVYDDAQKL